MRIDVSPTPGVTEHATARAVFADKVIVMRLIAHNDHSRPQSTS